MDKLITTVFLALLVFTANLIAESPQPNYIYIGIRTTASAADKNTLAALIVQKLDPLFEKSMAVEFWKKSNHSIRYMANNWDLNNGNIKVKWTVADANAYLANHAGDFDNVNDIKILAGLPDTFEIVPDGE